MRNAHIWDGVALALLLLVVLTALAGWFTHVMLCIQALTSEAVIQGGYMVLLIVGVIFPPVGIIHGIGHWFGAW